MEKYVYTFPVIFYFFWKVFQGLQKQEFFYYSFNLYISTNTILQAECHPET